MAKTILTGPFKKTKSRSRSQWWLDVPAGKFVSTIKPDGLVKIDLADSVPPSSPSPITLVPKPDRRRSPR